MVAPDAAAVPKATQEPRQPKGNRRQSRRPPPMPHPQRARPRHVSSGGAGRNVGLANIDALVHVPAAAIPKPGERLDVEAATRAYLDELPPEARARSDAYFRRRLPVDPDRLRLCARRGRHPLVLAAVGKLPRPRATHHTLQVAAVGIYALQYLIVGTILSLPLIIYDEWYREHEFGLSNQTLPEWATDYGIQFALGAPFFLVFIILLYALIRWTGSRWWIWGTAMAMVLLAIQVLLVPVYFAPAINKFEPLAQGELRDSILSMAREMACRPDKVAVRCLRQHKRISANVSGFSARRRFRSRHLLTRIVAAK